MHPPARRDYPALSHCSEEIKQGRWTWMAVGECVNPLFLLTALLLFGESWEVVDTKGERSHALSPLLHVTSLK